MKTTVEIDEKKLGRVMTLCGIKTRREAIDHALTEAERHARLRKALKTTWTPERLKRAIDPDYDVLKLREKDKPRHGYPG